MALAREDYEIDLALSGEEAMKKEGEKTYDVIIADLMMPGLNGLDLLKALKARASQAPFIMITGYPTMKNTLQAMQIGAFDFLPKPFLPSDLRSLVSRALAAGEKNRVSG
jgi:DNA-binding NtrC family response regulator